MATKDKTPQLSIQARRAIVSMLQNILNRHKQQEELREKMRQIDEAYARYKASEETTDGVDRRHAEKVCNVFAQDHFTAPIVVSEVDSYVAYLSDVFLSGYPIFPVLSTPMNRKYAEQLETLLDDHALLGGYPRQLLMFLHAAVKYNFGAVETDWDAIQQFSVMDDFTNGTGQKLNKSDKFFTRLKNIDMYNFVYDPDVLPGDISEHGDYAGYIELESAMKLKRRLARYKKVGKTYDDSRALASGSTTPHTGSNYYTAPPQISNYVSATRSTTNGPVNWDMWAAGAQGRRTLSLPGTGGHEIFTCYCRILPADLGISAPQPNTPQIWKFVLVNNSVLVYAERVISAYDYLPILVGQPMEDGLSYQTQSVAESAIPFQEAATTLFSIRFSAARRAVSDRALYRPDMINADDVNSAGAAPKIPVRISSLSQHKIAEAYQQIPFDMRGTETTISDASAIIDLSKKLHGQNNPRQGQFQKGNKSVQEWQDTMSGSENRLRLRALTLEYQFFSPLKSILGLNIMQYAENTAVVSQRTGDVVNINMEELRRQTLSFRISDGYTPKAKMASTEMLTTGMQMLTTSPILQQSYGDMLPDMFAHLMQLGGVRGLEEYSPAYRQKQQQQSPAGIEQQNLQTPPTVQVGPAEAAAALNVAAGQQPMPAEAQPGAMLPPV